MTETPLYGSGGARGGAGGGPGGASRGAPGGATRPKVTVRTIREMKARGERIASVTAYDFPTARIVDEAGVDLLLVGDSLGMVVLGYETTIPVTLAEMAHHTRAVARAKPAALLVADLPFNYYQAGPADAVRSSGRLIKCGAEAVKLEGGRRMLPQVEAILAADIPVLGHLGLTPQSIHSFGGYRVQGRGQEAAEALLEDALALEHAGCFAIVLEGVPLELGRDVTRALRIPTIGIGAGVHCDGQVLVFHDILGLSFGRQAKFVRRYADLFGDARAALAAFRDDVRAGRFPSAEESYGAAAHPATAAGNAATAAEPSKPAPRPSESKA
jgi:3-methyl-2-oxobutanoate hydroxymethyltransferase